MDVCSGTCGTELLGVGGGGQRMIAVFSTWFVEIVGEVKIHTAAGKVEMLLLSSCWWDKGSLFLEGWVRWLSSPGALVTEVLLSLMGSIATLFPRPRQSCPRSSPDTIRAISVKLCLAGTWNHLALLLSLQRGLILGASVGPWSCRRWEHPWTLQPILAALWEWSG